MTQTDIIAAVACAISGIAALFSGIALYQSAKANRSASQASERGLNIDLVDYPLKMRMDNGPELVSLALAQWAEEHGVMLEFIQPGKPMQNAFI